MDRDLAAGDKIDESLITHTLRAVDADVEHHPLTGFYTNARGMRQGSGELCKHLDGTKPDFFCISETHLDGDPARQLIPGAYKVAARLDRTKYGGGLLLGVLKHHLVDVLKLTKYNTVGVVEMAGFELNDTDIICCYTPDSRRAPRLLDAILQYHIDKPERPKIFCGDFNIHNPDWVCSTTKKADVAGRIAQEFCEIYGFNQLVDFPTRGRNTLDLIITSFAGSTTPLPGLGTSDHVAVSFTVNVEVEIPKPPIAGDTRDWRRAPWHHIKGAVGRTLADWKASDYKTPDMAQQDLESRLVRIRDQCVKKTKARVGGVAPWWNRICSDAFKHKQRALPL